MSVKIASFNARGLQESVKRRSTLNFLRDKKKDIYFIQETHCGESQGKLWKNEWGGPAFFTESKSNCVGVAILINNSLSHKIHTCKIDERGRFIILDISINEKRFTLVNIYAPNSDSPEYFQQIKDCINKLDNIDIIIGGDFNVISDPDEDKQGGENKIRLKEAHKMISKIKEELDLIDVYRSMHPLKREYTWRQRTPRIQCRLDYFLISTNLINMAVKSHITPGFRSDHSLVHLDLELIKHQQGRGFWKLNSTLLNDPEYVKTIKSCIAESKESELHPTLKWEMLKMEIRGKSISYSSFKNKESKRKVNTLEDDIAKLEKNQTLDENLTHSLESKRKELEEIYEQKAKGCMLRAKARWIDEGEKPTKYFLNLEKRNSDKKHIIKLEVEGKIVTDLKLILEEEKVFYQNLYSTKLNMNDLRNSEGKLFPNDNSIPKLNETEKERCEGEITENECLKSLKDMKNNKSPGTDGLTAEFYKMFWSDIKILLLDSLNSGYEVQEMSVEQKRGIIILIPKKGKNELWLKNWRPITLLNIDYKLAAKCMAERLKKVLPNLISPDQSGFLKGRFIGENIRNVEDLIEYYKNTNNKAMLLFLDFEKAFDSIEWPFLHKTLHYLNFGESFIRWITTLYNNCNSCILNYGHATEFFHLQRGMRQGCPLSPYLFILCAEMMAHLIRKDPKIQGIKINNMEFKINQYADDTVLFLDPNKQNILNTLESLTLFSRASGLNINVDKSEAISIGKDYGMKPEWMNDLDIKWHNDKVKFLGIYVGNNSDQLVDLNYKSAIKNMETTLNMWRIRDLSIIGKITILKALGMSQLVYMSTALQDPPAQIVKEIETIMYTFLWNGKKDRIKRKTIIAEYEKGGLKMPHYPTFCESLKISWVRRYLTTTNDVIWKTIIDEKTCGLGFFLWECNINQADCKKLPLTLFWKDVFKAWSKLNYKENLTNVEMANQIIWFNSAVKCKNNTICENEFIQTGIIRIKDLYVDGNILEINDLREAYDYKFSNLKHRAIIKSVPFRWKQLLKGDKNCINEPRPPNVLIDKMYQCEKVCREFYPILISKNIIEPKKAQARWENIFDKKIDFWEDIYLLSRKISFDTKLQSFQYKLLHHAIFTNTKLVKMNIVESSLCTFCNSERETIPHLFWFCEKTNLFLGQLFNWLQNKISQNMKINMTVYLLGDPSVSNIENYLYMLAKWYIYVCKVKTSLPSFKGFYNIIISHRNVERQIYNVRQRLPLFYKKWQVLGDL